MRESVLIKASVDVLKLYSIGKDINKKSCKFLESFELNRTEESAQFFAAGTHCKK